MCMKKWSATLIFTALTLGLFAQELSPGYTFTDGQRLTAAQLGQLVSLATVQTAFYTDKSYQGAPANGDLFLVYSASSGTFHKLTAASLLYTNYAIISSQVQYATAIKAATFLFYDPTNMVFGQISLSNLSQVVSSGIQFSNVVLYNTNGLQLPIYNTTLTATNNPLYVVVFDTNGVPSALTLSNVFSAYQAYIYTNWTVPWVYKQIFTPWSFYGTNANFTNAWGTQIPFAITNLAMTGTNLNTLTDTDTVPVASGMQQTNTVLSLYALYQYLTNKNALPPFTIARVQFSGLHVGMTVTNMSLTTGIITNIANAAAWTTPTAVSWQGAASQIPTSPVALSNTVYYALLTNTTPIGFQIYTNLVNANARTNYILGNGVNPSATGTLLWVTNYTAFACDAIQLSSGTSVRTGVYAVDFRSPAVNALYYITPSTGLGSGTFGVVNIELANAYDYPTTNGFTVSGKVPGATYYEPSLVHVLVNPQ